MGLAIDYALFVISRFREELAQLPEDDPNASAKAMRVTMATAGRTVLFSGLTVAAAMSSLLIFPQNFLRSPRVRRHRRRPRRRRRRAHRAAGDPDAARSPDRRRPAALAPAPSVAVDTDHGAWARLAHAVMRRPVVVMVVIVGALLVVASPFLGVEVGLGRLPGAAAGQPGPRRRGHAQRGVRPGDARPRTCSSRPTDKAEVSAYIDEVKQVDGVLDVRTVASAGRCHPAACVVGRQQPDRRPPRTSSRRSATIPGPGGRGRARRWPHRGHRRPALLARSRTCRGWR